MLSKLRIENLRIATKILVIVALFATVSVGATGFAALRMKRIDDSYSDLIARVDTSNVLSAQAARFVAQYQSKAYQLAQETTDEGNKRLLAEALASSKRYDALIAKVRQDVPEQADAIDAASAAVQKAFDVCDPVLRVAATTPTAEDTAKAASRLKRECNVPLEASMQGQFKLTDGLIAYAAKASNNLTDATGDTIRIVLVSVGIGLLTTIAIALWIGLRGLSRPIGRLNRVMESFARNDLTPETPDLRRGDEIGAMARTVEVFKKNALEVNRLRAEQEALKQHAADERRHMMSDLAAKFEAGAGGILDGVTAQATELQATAQSMTAISEATSRQSTTVAAASEQVAQNVNAVAGAAEELASSVTEILQQVTGSTRLIHEAVGDTEAANSNIQILADAVQKIGQVVDLIKNIAGQTNLLALNATIEAARAGDAGKGFAVVASEVKALANQTARATDEITQQIAAIQAATTRSVQSIQGIGERIANVRETSAAIAAAVEQQGAATAEIARNVAQAAEGTRDVTANIASVNVATQHSGAAADQVLAAASSLSQNSEQLKLQVDTFLLEVRAA